jgi:hypothetical protein
MPTAAPRDWWVTAWEPQEDGSVEVQFTYMDGKVAWVHLAWRAVGVEPLELVATGVRDRPPKLLGAREQAQRASQVQQRPVA